MNVALPALVRSTVSPHFSLLRNVWPATFIALNETYYAGMDWSRTLPDGSNDAGYMVAGLARYKNAWKATHGHVIVSQDQLDRAAAHEIRYHHERGRVMRRPCAMLSTCLSRLVVERPERISGRRTR